MATLVQSSTQGSAEPAASANVTITVTAGNRLVVQMVQRASATRTYSVSDTVNGAWPAADVYYNNGQAMAIFSFPNAAAGSTTVTVTASSSTNFSFFLHEVSGTGSTTPTVDSNNDATNGNTHQGGSTGVSTSTGGIVFVAGALNSAATLTVAGSSPAYTNLNATPTNQILMQYRTYGSGLSGEVGTWTSTGTARAGDGVIAAYDDAGGGGGNRRRRVLLAA